jgi:hypothetical protein
MGLAGTEPLQIGMFPQAVGNGPNFGALRLHDSLARRRREIGVETPEKIELQQHEQMIL